MIIVGLSGYARSGKDTVADLLVEHHGFQKRAIADGLRQVCELMDPVVPINIPIGAHGYDVEVYPRLSSILGWSGGWEGVKQDPICGPAVRKLLQTVGSAVCKVLGEDVWARGLDLSDPKAKYVISDVRFPGEARYLRSQADECKFWRVDRGLMPINDHHSETAMDLWGYDQIIRNTGNLEDLSIAVDTSVGYLCL